MAGKNERFVGIFELTVRPTRAKDVTAPLSIDAIRAVKRAADDARTASQPLRREIIPGSLYIILDEVKIYPSRALAAFLFTVADVNAADAVYRKIGTSSIRQFRKGPDEGGAASAHLVIRTDAQPNTQRYRAGLEDIESVSRSRIVPFLEELFRKYAGPVSAQTEDGVRSGDAVFHMDSVQKDRLEDAAGRPTSVELVRLRPRTKLDPTDFEGFEEVRRTVAFRIDRTQTVVEALASLVRLRRRQQTTSEFQGYPLMRIRWKRADGRSQTLSVDSLADDLLERAFTRMELITNITPDMPASLIDIRDDFVHKIGRKI